AGIVAGAIIGSIATTEDDLFGMAILATVLIYIVEFGVLVTMIVKKREPKVTIGNQPAVAPMISSAVDNYRYAAYCTSCGQELHDSARFCRNCGQMARPAASGGLIANNQAAQPAR
ncbi:MAG: zinc ribbon domain-containing protein, partial [Dehalococcoidia bacterium]|nr:zinc ribbon domain-containing protein [Dehalococcoidia bacterium]